MKTYVVSSVKIWGGGQNGKPDQNGRYGMSLGLEGLGEPVDYFSPIKAQPGDIFEGMIVKYKVEKGVRVRLETPEFSQGENERQKTIDGSWAIQTIFPEYGTDGLKTEENQNELLDNAECLLKLRTNLIERMK